MMRALTGMLLGLAGCLISSSATGQRFSYDSDGSETSGGSLTTFVVDNDDGWDGLLTVAAVDGSTVLNALANAGCTIVSGFPFQIECNELEDFESVASYVRVLIVEISSAEGSGTTIRSRFHDGAEAWAFMPTSSDTTAMEVMQEDSDDCTWTCTFGQGVYDNEGNSIPPFIECFETEGSSCCNMECPSNPNPPGDGASRLGGSLQRLGAATF